MSLSRATVSMSEAVADYVRRQIHQGSYSPGQRLPSQRELATTLEVSRASVSAGLHRLVEAGYLEMRRGATGGAFVTELSQPFEAWKRRLRTLAGELEELTEFRVAVESQLAGLAAQRARRDDLESMRLANRRLAEGTGRLPEARAVFRANDTLFHYSVASAARNKRLEDAARRARSDLFTPYDLLEYEEPFASVLHDHQEIYAAIKSGDGEAAARLMREHIERTRDQLASFVRGD